MTITIRAVYERGILRPVQPLALDEGETVDVTIAKSGPAPQAVTDEEIARRLKSAATIADWVGATKLLPAHDGGYDIIEALNENRLRSGERPLIPDEDPTP